MAKKAEFNIETVRKYSFWICIPIALILSGVGFYLGAVPIDTKIKEQIKKLDAAKKQIQQVRNTQPHPNKSTIDEINVEAKGLSGKVLTGWETLEKDQRERNVWSQQLGQRALEDIHSQKFLGQLRESTVKSYLEYAKATTRDLPKVVNPIKSRGQGQYGTAASTSRRSGLSRSRDARRDSRSSARGRGNAAMGELDGDEDEEELEAEKKETGFVVWDDPYLIYTLTDWDKDAFRVKPYEVWFTQEEIWVYQALLDVIKKQNEKAGTKSPKSAAVKRIDDILIGQEAALVFEEQNDRVFSSGLSGYGRSSYGRGDYDDYERGGRGGAGPGSGMGETGSSKGMKLSTRLSHRGASSGMPGSYAGRDRDEDGGDTAVADGLNYALIGRYLQSETSDSDSESYMGTSDQTSGSAGTPAIAEAPFRQMSVYLNLLVDQTKLADLLTECANCTMPINVLWVRMNPEQSPPFDFTSNDQLLGSPTRMGMSSGRGRDRSDLGMGSGRGQSRPNLGMGDGTSRGQTDAKLADIVRFGANAVQIEIFGYISIFSPPDVNKLPQAKEIIATDADSIDPNAVLVEEKPKPAAKPAAPAQPPVPAAAPAPTEQPADESAEEPAEQPEAPPAEASIEQPAPTEQ